MLITDYSSIFFDFGYLNKPVIYSHFDYNEYRANHFRKGYFDYIKNEMSKGQSIGLLILILIMDIILSIFLIGNEFTNEESYDDSFMYDFKNYQFKVVRKSSSFFTEIWISIVSGIASFLVWVNKTLTPLSDVFEKYKY